MAEWERAFDDEAFARAQQRLEAVLSGQDRPRPVGRFAMPVILAVVLLVLPAAALVWGAHTVYTDHRHPSPAAGTIFAILAVVLLLAAYYFIVNASPNTPKRALSLFYKGVGRGFMGRARRLVLASDFDELERFPPGIAGFGPHLQVSYFFGVPGEFAAYWKDLVRYHALLPYCLVRVRDVETTEAFPNVYLADFRVRFIMNTRLWFLLALIGCVGLLIAVIIDAVTRKTVQLELRKILVRNGDEWFLFNGELQGVEEEQTGWLTGEFESAPESA